MSSPTTIRRSPLLFKSIRQTSRWRPLSILTFAIPPLLLLLLYHDSFEIWFRSDDFSLLTFVRRAHSFNTFLVAVFSTYAQGTIRPLSERLPFLISSWLFGDDCLALRILVFLTAVADTILIVIVVRRITGSQLAGLTASVLWVSSAAIISPMTWNSSYNEVQYPLFLLAALALFMRYGDTGKSSYWWWQLIIFVLGFGSLENNIVYPAIAAAWALFVADPGKKMRLLAATIPLFIISVTYYFVHLYLAPLAAGGLYAIHIDARIADTLWEYWKWAFLPPEWRQFDFPLILGNVIRIVSMGSFLVFILWQLCKRRTVILFYLSWFLLTLGPMLLLPDRHTEYYLAGPIIGLAMAAGWAVCLGWREGVLWRTLMLIPLAAWFAAMLPSVTAATQLYAVESDLSRYLVLGVKAARETHRDKALLLDDISQQLYDLCIFESAFRAFGIDNVYLTPGARQTIHPPPNDRGFDAIVADPAVVRHALKSGEAMVYRFSVDHLKNITDSYTELAEATFPSGPPARIEMANSLYGYLLGPEWLPPQPIVRWMPGHATLTIAGPASPGRSLIVSGFCWGEQLKRGPIHISIAADGHPVGTADIRLPETEFQRSFPIPASLTGRPAIMITIDAGPPARVGSQDYGAMFKYVAIGT